jgi:uncharacterized protein (DUF58 family)
MQAAEIAAQVKRLQILTGRPVADVLAGQYLSVFKGPGIEFDEVRPYVPGDDVRTIDWNVTARHGAPYVKRYVEERELTVLLVVDVSASLDFGSGARPKREAAAELSALVAFSAAQNDDKVGLLLFHGATEAYIPPRKGARHALRVVRDVLAHDRPDRDGAPRPRLPRTILDRLLRLGRVRRSDPRRETHIAAALEFCRRVLPRRAVLFLVSDFLDEGYLSALRSANRRHDLVAVHVGDRREREPVDAGLLTLEDAETGRRLLVDTGSAAFRADAAAVAGAREAALAAELGAAGIDLIRVDATRSVVEPLVAFFQRRKKRLRR